MYFITSTPVQYGTSSTVPSIVRPTDGHTPSTRSRQEVVGRTPGGTSNTHYPPLCVIKNAVAVNTQKISILAYHQYCTTLVYHHTTPFRNYPLAKIDLAYLHGMCFRAFIGANPVKIVTLTLTVVTFQWHFSDVLVVGGWWWGVPEPPGCHLPGIIVNWA